MSGEVMAGLLGASGLGNNLSGACSGMGVAAGANDYYQQANAINDEQANYIQWAIHDQLKKNNGGNPTMLGEFKMFVREHRDLLFTVLLVLLLDHFIFNGAFKDRVESVVNGLVKKAENKIGVLDVSK